MFENNYISYRVESKYLGFTLLLKTSFFDNEVTEPQICDDVFCDNDGKLYIGFANGFAPKDDCYFLIQ